MNLAAKHSSACQELMNEGALADAVHYCLAQGVLPPFPPCDRTSPDYEQCAELAKETLSDYGWWEKRLKLRDARAARQGEKSNVENG